MIVRVSKSYGISEKYLEQIVSILAKAKIENAINNVVDNISLKDLLEDEPETRRREKEKALL